MTVWQQHLGSDPAICGAIFAPEALEFPSL
jgi:hypothetical protein